MDIMKTKKYVRVLLLVVVSMVIGLMILVGIDEKSDFKSSLMIIDKNPNSANPNYVDPLEGMGTDFPLHDTLIQSRLFDKQHLKTFGNPIKLIQKGISLKDLSPQQEQRVCDTIAESHELEVSANKLLPAELKDLLRQLHADKHAYNVIKDAEEKLKPTLPMEAQWFRFAGASVWLEEFKVHYMVSRLIYSPSGIPNKGFASFLYVQVYNQKWEEITTELNLPYERHLSQNNVADDGTLSEEIVEKTVAYRKVKFPSLLPIKFRYSMNSFNSNYYWGPEDPRILKRKNHLGFDEPIIVFNLKSILLSKRVMHLYLPFSNDLKILEKRSEPFANVEKNWTPFVSSSHPNNTLGLVYSFSPLEVMTCEIDTGVCDFLQRTKKSDLNKFGSLRGDTQMEPLPLHKLPKVIRDKFHVPNRSVYIGWGKTHLNKCGCGESMYRPNLIVLTEDYNPELDQYHYNIHGLSEFIDFNADIPPWFTPELDDQGNLIKMDPEQDQPTCGDKSRNVLIPNSIAYWDIKGIVVDGVTYDLENYHNIPNQDSLELKNIEFNDYMGVTLSAADNDVSITHVKGLLGYILKIGSIFDHSTVLTSKDVFDIPGFGINQKCSETAGKKYCEEYGKARKAHQDEKDEPKENKENKEENKEEKEAKKEGKKEEKEEKN